MNMLSGDLQRMRAALEPYQSITFSPRAQPPVASSPAGTGGDILALVHKTTQGYTEGEFAQASIMGYDAWIEYQLAYESIDDSALEDLLASLFPSLAMTGPELYANYGVPGDFGTVINDLRIAALARSILSPRQLFERMVEFWTDHFNIFHLHSEPVALLKTVDDREVIRAHALGSFPDMLRASTKSGAMIIYLDNLTNIVGAPNENYSRELMELHALGVDGPYNEQDVQELARCFTGWTLTGAPVNWGEFIFYPPFHDFGPKTVLGIDIPAGGGISDAETIVDHLAMHPTTAAFVSRKMIQWILGYEPPQALVDQTANIYLATSGDIKQMLRFILRRNHVMANVPFDQRKHKRPAAFFTGLLRQTQPESIGAFDLIFETFVMGQLPFNWGPPDGYPDTVAAWGGAVLPRWDLAARYLGEQLVTSVSAARLFQLMGTTPTTQWASRINFVLTGGYMTPQEESEIQTYIDTRGPTARTLRDAFALAASTPSYQYY
ncbi:MAG: DUF1800 domain-containing protein [bacterium]|nr:DUF1800 domain-containing protein [bacterium]